MWVSPKAGAEQAMFLSNKNPLAWILVRQNTASLPSLAVG